MDQQLQPFKQCIAHRHRIGVALLRAVERECQDVIVARQKYGGFLDIGCDGGSGLVAR